MARRTPDPTYLVPGYGPPRGAAAGFAGRPGGGSAGDWPGRWAGSPGSADLPGLADLPEPGNCPDSRVCRDPTDGRGDKAGVGGGVAAGACWRIRPEAGVCGPGIAMTALSSTAATATLRVTKVPSAGRRRIHPARTITAAFPGWTAPRCGHTPARRR